MAGAREAGNNDGRADRHQRSDRQRTDGGHKPHAAGSGDGAPKSETHGDHEHKTPSAGNRNRQRRRTRGGNGSGNQA